MVTNHWRFFLKASVHIYIHSKYVSLYLGKVFLFCLRETELISAVTWLTV